eukprot:Rhum_TRINITY_DN14902_c2_g3::Rhum_TRINITY_DN14902_c2_g3_i1::g.127128::m.127128
MSLHRWRFAFVCLLGATVGAGAPPAPHHHHHHRLTHLRAAAGGPAALTLPRGNQSADGVTLTASASASTSEEFPSAGTKRLLSLSVALVDAAGAASVAAMLLGGSGASALSIARQALVLRSAECEWHDDPPRVLNPLRLELDGSKAMGTAVANISLMLGLLLIFLALTRLRRRLADRLAFFHFPGIFICLATFLTPATLAAGVELLRSRGSKPIALLAVVLPAVTYVLALFFYPAAVHGAAYSPCKGRGRVAGYVLGKKAWHAPAGSHHISKWGLLFIDYKEIHWVKGRYLALESLSAVAVGLGSGVGYAEGTVSACMATNITIMVALALQALLQIISGLYSSLLLTHMSTLALLLSVAGLVGITSRFSTPEVETAGGALLLAASVLCLLHVAVQFLRIFIRLAGLETVSFSSSCSSSSLAAAAAAAVSAAPPPLPPQPPPAAAVAAAPCEPSLALECPLVVSIHVPDECGANVYEEAVSMSPKSFVGSPRSLPAGGDEGEDEDEDEEEGTERGQRRAYAVSSPKNLSRVWTQRANLNRAAAAAEASTSGALQTPSAPPLASYSPPLLKQSTPETSATPASSEGPAATEGAASRASSRAQQQQQQQPPSARLPSMPGLQKQKSYALLM